MLEFSRFLAASSACAALSLGTFAHAETTAQHSFPSAHQPWRLEASGGAAFGNTTLPTGESINAFGPSIGLRAGYALSFGGTLALRYDHFFGTTSSYPIPLVALVEHRTSAHFMAADLGFEFTPSQALIRPHVSIGGLAHRLSTSCDAVNGSYDSLANSLCSLNKDSKTSWNLAAAPGLLMGLGWSRYYGFVDIQYLFSEVNAYGIVGGFGFTL
jgi:hypothetical protein